MDDDIELNIVINKPKPKVPITSFTSNATVTPSNTTTTSTTSTFHKESKPIGNNQYKQSYNNNNNQNNNNNNQNNNNFTNNRFNKQPNTNRFNNSNNNNSNQNNNKEEENVKHRYANQQQEQQQYGRKQDTRSQIRKIEGNMRYQSNYYDPNYKPELPTMEPAVKEIASSEVFSEGNFGDLSLTPRIANTLVQKMKMAKPTIIQSASIPHILKGEDVLVKAQTGSGKTLAYIIPILQLLTTKFKVKRDDGCYAMVLAPTRELASQIYEVLVQLLDNTVYIIPGLVIGGENRVSEKKRLKKGVSILVATPGRILDHLDNTKAFKIENVRWLVLDEADRLLDLGFEKSIIQLLNCLNKAKSYSGERKHILVSATLNDGIAKLATLTLTNPTYVGLNSTTNQVSIKQINDSNVDEEEETQPVGKTTNPNLQAAMNGKQVSKDLLQIKEGEKLDAPKQLEQYFAEVEARDRLVSLIAFIKWKTTKTDKLDGNSKIIVFFSSCDSVDFHYHLFGSVKLESEDKSKQADKSKPMFIGDPRDQPKQVKVKSPLFSTSIYKLHGDIDQAQRAQTYSKFQNAKRGILLTTDVSARGLDLPHVNWIVQYDPSSDTKDYVHRIGRTARIGNTGSSLIFLLPTERKYTQYLLRKGMQTQEMNVTTILQSLYHTTEGQLSKTSKFTQLESQIHDLQLLLERTILEDETGKDLARKAYRSFLRAYSTHSRELQSIFHISCLHLGHISKSFALRETPTELNKITTSQDKKAKKEGDKEKSKKTVDYKMRNYKETNEFGNGLSFSQPLAKKRAKEEDSDEENTIVRSNTQPTMLPTISSKSTNGIKKIKRSVGF